MYAYYYTASDVTVTFVYQPTDRVITIDKCISVGFRHSMSSVPIYGLGNINPAFFSKGNSLVQGQFDLAFKTNAYLITAFNYLLDTQETSSEGQRLQKKMEDSANDAKKPKLTDEEFEILKNYLAAPPVDMVNKSISNINFMFDIHITFNNSNSARESKSKVIKIIGVKITEETLSVMSHDEGTLVDRYSFMAKNIL